ncbi:MAG: polysaccharide deacetylase family protein [Micromonosporaceae bacterium]|nr:polysaccharide deacetylase family protein [Micromonosporaceae bacterium]
MAVGATAIAILVGLYGAGHLLGRATGPAAEPNPASAATGAPGAAAPALPAADPPAAAAAPAVPPVPAPVPPAGVPALPVSVQQPFTGPGKPPLPMTGSGPHGTLRTTGQPFVALTFDDGPDPRWTPEVLELLRTYGVKATFCVVGELVSAYPDLVRQIGADGHTICNHSWGHDVGLGSRPRAAIRADLHRTNVAIQAAAPGARVSYYRQPGGAWTRRVVEVAEELGMSSLHWAVDPQDWSQPGARQIADAVTADTGAGEIVLLHDGGGQRNGTVRALDRFLPELAGRLRVDALPPGVDPPRYHGRELPLKPSQI